MVECLPGFESDSVAFSLRKVGYFVRGASLGGCRKITRPKLEGLRLLPADGMKVSKQECGAFLSRKNEMPAVEFVCSLFLRADSKFHS